MTTEQMILDRLDRLESQIAPLTASAKAIGELREELAPRVNEAVQALIVELADVEADFQLEDLVFLLKKMMRNIKNLNFVLDQMKNLIDFALTAEPLFKSSVPQAIAYLDDLERQGCCACSAPVWRFSERWARHTRLRSCSRPPTAWCAWRGF